MNEDEQLDLLTLTWIGRGDFDIADFAKARDEAVNLEHKHISLYSKQTPLFSDYLEEGLSLAGYDLDQYERDHF